MEKGSLKKPLIKIKRKITYMQQRKRRENGIYQKWREIEIYKNGGKL